MDYVIIHEGSLLRAHTTDEKGKKIMMPLRGVRGALTWPTKLSPMYFLIIAQESSSNDAGKCQLHLIHEETGDSPAQFFQRLIEVARKDAAQQVYADLNQQHKEMISLFNEVCRYHQGIIATLSQAPLANAFQVGLGLIKEWLPSINIPDGQLKTELSQFSQIHRESARAEEEFAAIKALSYILASLELGPWQRPHYGNSTGRKTRLRGIV
jgi:hypothetical protein